MKRFYPLKKRFFNIVSLILVFAINANRVHAQITTIASGAWNNAGIWSTGTVPGASDDVILQHSVSMPGGTNQFCASLTFASGPTAINLSFATSSLTVSGAILVHAGTASAAYRSIGPGVGTLSCGSITMDATGADDISTDATIYSGGTLNVSGDIVMAEAVGSLRNRISFSGNFAPDGKLNVGGSITGGRMILTSFCTINYNGNSASQSVRNENYTRLVLSGSGFKTGTFSASKLTMTGNATFNGTANSIGTLEYNGNTPQTIGNEFPPSATTAQLGQVVINNSWGVTLNTPRTLNANLTLLDGILATGNNITLGTNEITITRREGEFDGVLQGNGAYNVLYDNASFEGPAPELMGPGLKNFKMVSSQINLAENVTCSGTLRLESGSSLRIGPSITLSCGSVSMANFNDDNNISIYDGTLSVLGNITLAFGGTVNTISFPVGTSGRLNVGGSLTGDTDFRLQMINTDCTVEYNGTGASQAMYNATYPHLVLSGSGTKTGAVAVSKKLTIQGTATVANTVTYSPNAILEYNGSAFQTTSNNELPSGTTNLSEIIINNASGVTLGGLISFTSPRISLVNGPLNTADKMFVNSPTILSVYRSNGSMTGAIQGTGTYNVFYTGSSKSTTAELSGLGLLNDITIDLNSNNDTLILDQTRISKGNFSLNKGVFDLRTFQLNNSPSTGKFFNIAAGTTVVRGSFASMPFGFTYNFDPASTVCYNGGDQQVVENYPYGNLTLAGTGEKKLGAHTNINGNLRVEPGATLTLGLLNLTLGANANRTATILGTVNINDDGRLLRGGTGTKTLVLGAGSFLNITDKGGSTFPDFSAYSLNRTSTVVYGASDGQTINIAPSPPAYGNLVVSGGNTKTIQNAATDLNVTGDLTIAINTTLQSNNKTIHLEGNWTNNGSFTSGTGFVRLVSQATSQTQTIAGSSISDFTNLEIQSAANGIVLNQSIRILTGGEFKFINGIVSTGNNRVIFAPGSSASSINSFVSSFVEGEVEKIGNTPFIFPVGKKSSGYHPVSIAAPASVTDAFSAKYIRANATALGSNFAVPILNVSNCEYWELKRISGFSQPNVTISWTPNSSCGGNYVTSLNGIRPVMFFNNSWRPVGNSPGAGTTTNGTSQITGPALSWSSVPTPVALGNIQSGANPLGIASTLPVIFSSFTVYEKQPGVQLDWTVDAEENVSHYVVERSSDGISFSTIGTVQALNNGNQTTYGFFDAQPIASSINFYRVRNVDIDGKSAYTRIAKIILNIHDKNIVFYPNPVRDGYISIQSSQLDKGKYFIQIMNAAGQKVYSKLFNHPGGAVNHTIHLPARIITGMYWMQVNKENNAVINKTFIVR